jgi:RHS repeat-associated protein
METVDVLRDGPGGVNLTYGSPDSGGGYAGLDRFGRVIDQKWQTDGCSPTVLDEYRYGYDPAGPSTPLSSSLSLRAEGGAMSPSNGNRTYRENTLTCGLDELYAYDDLARLTSFKRGDLNTGKTDILSPSVTRGWTLDQLGNWQGLDTDGDSQPNQTRAHDAANEITRISESCSQTSSPTYDPAGNMTGDGTLTYTYDAWNRLTETDLGENVVAVYSYDGLNRRVSKAVAVRDACGNLTGYDRTDYQYDEAWQVLEERFTANQSSAATVATAPHAQYVWDIRYVDAPVLRLRDTAGPSCSQPDGDLDDSGDEVVYYTNDANMNVTALVNTSGEVVERYAYEAYGAPTILNGVKDAAGTNTSTSEWDERTVATFQNEILNNGYRYNYETGNSQVRWREYSPTLGRWLTRDPAGYVDGTNLHQYAIGNPPTRLDQLGLASTQPATQPASISEKVTLTLDAPGKICARGSLNLWYTYYRTRKDKSQRVRTCFANADFTVTLNTLCSTSESPSFFVLCAIRRDMTVEGIRKYNSAISSLPRHMQDPNPHKVTLPGTTKAVAIQYLNLLSVLTMDRTKTQLSYLNPPDDFGAIMADVGGQRLLSTDWNAINGPKKDVLTLDDEVNVIAPRPFALTLPENAGEGTFRLWYQYMDGNGGTLGAFIVRWRWRPSDNPQLTLEIESVDEDQPHDLRKDLEWTSDGRQFQDKLSCVLVPAATTMPTSRPSGK